MNSAFNEDMTKINVYSSCNISIMAACTAKKMPVVIERDGEDVIAVRMMMKLVIGGDHRILDGVPLAAFLNDMKLLLEDPKALV